MNLTTPIRYVPGVGPILAKRLDKLGIKTVKDLLFHIPFRYEDFSLITSISQMQEGETMTIRGKVIESKNIFTKYRKKIQQVWVEDSTGTIEITWFNQPFLIKNLPIGSYVSLSGKVKRFGSKLTLGSPQYEVLKGIQDTKYSIQNTLHTGRLVPVYPETAGISSKWLRGKISLLLQTLYTTIPDCLPQEIIKEENFLSLPDALSKVHFPQTQEDTVRARARLAFDELFILQLTNEQRKKEWHTQKATKALTISQKTLSEFISSLPFRLTSAQDKVTEEILADLTKITPMNRLLEGDVGSGKTVVASIAAYVAYKNNLSTLIMAPTEILAQQHYITFHMLFAPFGIEVDLITASTKKDKVKVSKNPALITQSQKKAMAENCVELALNQHKKKPWPKIVLGTHALLHQELSAETTGTVGLVVIDEQHRFGVAQRALLRTKNASEAGIPHVLTMTATPIPRTIALTIYGDLDLSVIDEAPIGRKPVKTWLVPPHKRTAAYEWIKSQMTQTFIICPFIEESETFVSVKAATGEYERLKKEVFPELRVGLIHGRMKAREKETVLRDFKEKKYDILVATPIVEVGIDIPNASIMVIEASERFGLSQLHQLRGRVGRGNQQCYCLLFTDSRNHQTITRLKHLAHTHQGATLAQLDLELRGPGEVYGTIQHGIPQLTVASYSDFATIKKAKLWAQQLLMRDLELSSFPLLKEYIEQSTITPISPD